MGSCDQGGCHQGGTLYGGGGRLGPSRVRHLRIALAVGATGVVLGALLATGALSEGDGPTGRWVGPTGIGPAGPGGTAAGAGHPPLPRPAAEPGGIRRFRSVASSLCLAAPADGGTDPHQAGCGVTAGPRWLPAPVQPGVVVLVSVATGYCLSVDVPDGGDGAPVRQRPCLGGEHQRWRRLPVAGPTRAAPPAAPVPVARRPVAQLPIARHPVAPLPIASAPVTRMPVPVAPVVLVNVLSGRCLTLPAAVPPATPPGTPGATPPDTPPGTAIRQVSCRGTADQRWVEEPPG